MSIGVCELPPAIHKEISAWAESAFPHEACGLIVGTFTSQGARVLRAAKARNLNTERARDRYLLDPADFHRVEREAVASGLEVVGFWHSHPDHPAQPSRFDSDHAWENYVYLIVKVQSGRAEDLNAFSLRERSLQPIALTP